MSAHDTLPIDKALGRCFACLETDVAHLCCAYKSMEIGRDNNESIVASISGYFPQTCGASNSHICCLRLVLPMLVVMHGFQLGELAPNDMKPHLRKKVMLSSGLENNRGDLRDSDG